MMHNHKYDENETISNSPPHKKLIVELQNKTPTSPYLYVGPNQDMKDDPSDCKHGINPFSALESIPIHQKNNQPSVDQTGYHLPHAKSMNSRSPQLYTLDNKPLFDEQESQKGWIRKDENMTGDINGNSVCVTTQKKLKVRRKRAMSGKRINRNKSDRISFSQRVTKNVLKKYTQQQQTQQQQHHHHSLPMCKPVDEEKPSEVFSSVLEKLYHDGGKRTSFRFRDYKDHVTAIRKSGHKRILRRSRGKAKTLPLKINDGASNTTTSKTPLVTLIKASSNSSDAFKTSSIVRDSVRNKGKASQEHLPATRNIIGDHLADLPLAKPNASFSMEISPNEPNKLLTYRPFDGVNSSISVSPQLVPRLFDMEVKKFYAYVTYYTVTERWLKGEKVEEIKENEVNQEPYLMHSYQTKNLNYTPLNVVGRVIENSSSGLNHADISSSIKTADEVQVFATKNGLKTKIAAYGRQSTSDDSPLYPPNFSVPNSSHCAVAGQYTSKALFSSRISSSVPKAPTGNDKKLLVRSCCQALDVEPSFRQASLLYKLLFGEAEQSAYSPIATMDLSSKSIVIASDSASVVQDTQSLDSLSNSSFVNIPNEGRTTKNVFSNGHVETDVILYPLSDKTNQTKTNLNGKNKENIDIKASKIPVKVENTPWGKKAAKGDNAASKVDSLSTNRSSPALDDATTSLDRNDTFQALKRRVQAFFERHAYVVWAKWEDSLYYPGEIVDIRDDIPIHPSKGLAKSKLKTRARATKKIVDDNSLRSDDTRSDPFSKLVVRVKFMDGHTRDCRTDEIVVMEDFSKGPTFPPNTPLLADLSSSHNTGSTASGSKNIWYEECFAVAEPEDLIISRVTGSTGLVWVRRKLVLDIDDTDSRIKIPLSKIVFSETEIADAGLDPSSLPRLSRLMLTFDRAAQESHSSKVSGIDLKNDGIKDKDAYFQTKCRDGATGDSLEVSKHGRDDRESRECFTMEHTSGDYDKYAPPIAPLSTTISNKNDKISRAQHWRKVRDQTIPPPRHMRSRACHLTSNDVLLDPTESVSPLLGQLLPKGSQIFRGFAFFLTHKSPNVEVEADSDSCSSQCKGPSTTKRSKPKYTSKPNRSDDVYNNSSSNLSSSDNDTPLVCFNKQHLIAQILSGNGMIVENFDEVPIKTTGRRIMCVADTYSRSEMYLRCLAADIPTVSHVYIIGCCNESKLLNYENFVLPAGKSILDNRSITRKRTQKFNGIQVCFAPVRMESLTEEEKLCLSLMHTMGFNIVIAKSLDVYSLPNFVISLVENEALFSMAREFKVPMVTMEWLIQTLIHAELVPYYAHESFYNFK